MALLTTKPYLAIPIRENGEPMVALSPHVFCLKDPHPYRALGAPYGAASPWMLRRSVAASLLAAQTRLQTLRPDWRILLTDAYRPNAVQAFMVEREFALQAAAEGLTEPPLSEAARARLAPQVFALWALPSDDPATPPPHSTGAAFDCTLVDEQGHEVGMGCPVDENSPRALPDHFAHAQDAEGRHAHAHRTLLKDILEAEGFTRHPREWWHFSRGDQLAVWHAPDRNARSYAIYGRAAPPAQAGSTAL